MGSVGGFRVPGGVMATTSERGYGYAHRKLREQWARVVKRGDAVCWRCGRGIHPDEAWDLGHDDHDRSITHGPEHAGRCNRRAAAIKGNKMRARPRVTSRRWI